MIIFEANWSNISSDWIGYIMTGYEYIFGNWVYPIIFLGIVGYVYAVNRSAISAAAGICIVFAAFGVTGIFRFPEIVQFSALAWGITVTSIAGLFVLLFTKKGRHD